MKNARFLSALLLVGTALPLPVLANGAPTAAPSAPSAMKVLSRIDLAQAEQPTAKSTDDVRGASQTRTASPQPVGAFPTNDMSGMPVIGLDGDADAIKKDVAALQQTLT